MRKGFEFSGENCTSLKQNLFQKNLNLCLVILFGLTVFGFDNASVFAASGASLSPAAIIYDNGNLSTGATSENGVVAPAGNFWSELQNNRGDNNNVNFTTGFGCAVTGPVNGRCADDFVVPVGETWTINKVTLFVFQVNYTGTTSPVGTANLRIWNGRPGAPGSAIIFGDTTTNRLAASTETNLYRIFNSLYPTPQTGGAPNTNRRLWQVDIAVSPSLALTNGQYWLDWQIQGAAGTVLTPATTIVGTRGLPLWNGLILNFFGNWVAAGDGGANNAGTPAYNFTQDFPFKLDGTRTGVRAVPTSRTIDFNGDNKSDFVVVRSASATAQSTWFTLNSASQTNGTAWGLGVGLPGGDVATPADFDGDGRTDIAVWRPGNLAYFYILNSSNNTVRIEQFGRTGDDPTIVDDYDGDGKADPAVYRNGASAGAQSFFFYRPSATAGVDFRTAYWGIAGDKPYPGDFDGDGRADFAVVRNDGGSAVHYQNLSTAGVRAARFGLFADRFVTGDFDADYKNDLTAVRADGTNWRWFVLRSADGELFTTAYGAAATDIIVPGDYDGDNRTDFAVWRGGAGADAGTFFLLNTASSPSARKWGQSTATQPDYPAANAVNVH